MFLVFMVIFIVVANISIVKFIFEVVLFLGFDLNLDVEAASIFLERPKNFCITEETSLFPMDSTTVLMMKLLTIFFPCHCRRWIWIW